ncbi:MAG: GTP cyclohydrolase I FolE2 [Fibrobacteres bacterium]|jgi:GTP cyclohydrolase I|nr:GTP cyclohydrolase I FolE2 [Fibrobacterota bacterium]
MSISAALPDVQSESSRPARTEVVAGIDHVRILLSLPSGERTVATLELVARVPTGQRGVHMSRLYRTFAPDGRIELSDFEDRIRATAATQDSVELIATLSWEQLVERAAPATGSLGFHPIKLQLRAWWTPGDLVVATRLESAAMLACPCSKALSEDLGFHNQRGILQAEVLGNQFHRTTDLLACLDDAASNRVHPVLRREDEKEVIDVLSRRNSFRFVEDAASLMLEGLEAAGFGGISLHVRSMESIHAHDAVAWAGPRGQEMSEGIRVG